MHTPANLVASPAPNNILGVVGDDWAAIEVWMKSICKSRQEVSQTEITYRFHLQKFRWYCEKYIGLTPSRWKGSDANEFLIFLKDLPVAVISARGIDHNDSEWTPFKCKLSKSSRSDIQRFVHAMFKALYSTGYIRNNPMVLHAAQSARKIKVNHTISVDLFEVVLDLMTLRIGLTPLQIRKLARDRFIILALRDLGIRANELVSSNMSAFYQYTCDGKTYWIFRINEKSAKGSIERVIPVTQNLWNAFTTYRVVFGLREKPCLNENGALILSSKTTQLEERDIRAATLESKRIYQHWGELRTRQGLYKIVKFRLENAVDYLISIGQDQKAEMLKEASPHWLRHTFAKSALSSGISPRAVALAMGHHSVASTMDYVDKDAHSLVTAFMRTNPGLLAVGSKD